jgi:hypothetical protein
MRNMVAGLKLKTVTPSQMLSTFSWFFLSFSGRLSRQEFWLGYIDSIAVLAVLVRTLPMFVLPKTFYYSTRDELNFVLKLQSVWRRSARSRRNLAKGASPRFRPSFAASEMLHRCLDNSP